MACDEKCFCELHSLDGHGEYHVGGVCRSARSDPIADRQDMLAYQSEPLDERWEVTGNPEVVLHASSDAPDTDWFVRLIDVAPDGFARFVCQGVVRARYREGFDKPKLLEPDEIVKYAIRLKPTSNALLPGHRIRLDITSSDFPKYDRNPNTGHPFEGPVVKEHGMGIGGKLDVELQEARACVQRICQRGAAIFRKTA